MRSAMVGKKKLPFGLSVKALIQDSRGRILILRRPAHKKRNPHRWDLPGGKSEPKEAFDQVILREIREETGLKASITGAAGAVDYRLPHVHVVLLILRGRKTGGTLKLSEEHVEARWVTAGDLRKLPLSSELKLVLKAWSVKPLKNR